jgi:tetratricopeptide (TPR) repeat protein
VQSGSNVIAQFPVPLVDERTVSCRLRASVQAGPVQALEFRKDLWVRRIYDNLLAGAERVKEIDALAGKSLEAALARTREGAKILHEELNNLEQERTQLLRQASELKVSPAQFDLREGEQRLEELRARVPRIEEFIGRLEKAIKQAGSDETKQLLQMLERARLKEGQTEIDEAIALYEKVLAHDKSQAKVQAHLDKLNKMWAIRNPEHGRARELILKAWPRTEVAGLKAGLIEAKKAFETCQKNEDTLTPRKLLGANLAHAANLRKRLETLKRQDTEDNRAEARALATVAQELMQFHRAVTAPLKGDNK